MAIETASVQVVIVGGGPGGYEAALVAAQLGARVTLVERADWGGATVLADVVPSKTLIASAEAATRVEASAQVGVQVPRHVVNLAAVNDRVRALAAAQSADVAARLRSAGVQLLRGHARLNGPNLVQVTPLPSAAQNAAADSVTAPTALTADVVLLATGASPRTLPDAIPDGERILTWTQLYDLPEIPPRLVVVGSGVTGAEFASAYQALGSQVVLVSSRGRVLPDQDADAAAVVEAALTTSGMHVLSGSRAVAVHRTGDGVAVTLTDGRVVAGSHCLLAVGGVPNTAELGLAAAGVLTSASGHIEVDRVSRTNVRGVYAAGDCTGIYPLASVAAMQGRIAMYHALGDAVSPLNVGVVASCVFTSPQIASVGWLGSPADAGPANTRTVTLPLAGNARAKMLGISAGLVKVVCGGRAGEVLGAVVVAPQANELIFPLTLAVTHGLSVDDVAGSFTVYPSLTGSIAEAARQLHAAG